MTIVHGEPWDCEFNRAGASGSFLCLRRPDDTIHRPPQECPWLSEGRECPSGDHHRYHAPGKPAPAPYEKP